MRDRLECIYYCGSWFKKKKLENSALVYFSPNLGIKSS